MAHPASHADALDAMSAAEMTLARDLRAHAPQPPQPAAANPASALGLGRRKGRLAVGADADVLLDRAALEPLSVFARRRRPGACAAGGSRRGRARARTAPSSAPDRLDCRQGGL